VTAFKIQNMMAVIHVQIHDDIPFEGRFCVSVHFSGLPFKTAWFYPNSTCLMCNFWRTVYCKTRQVVH